MLPRVLPVFMSLPPSQSCPSAVSLLVDRRSVGSKTYIHLLHQSVRCLSCPLTHLGHSSRSTLDDGFVTTLDPVLMVSSASLFVRLGRSCSFVACWWSGRTRNIIQEASLISVVWLSEVLGALKRTCMHASPSSCVYTCGILSCSDGIFM